ncbi:tetratricopeptide repeat protein [Pseudoalteromonas sp. US3C1013]|uniref:tetratricopeptide repeat protein n=1 Tax=unclassified Pseudoalteromonas TaxID=194690 RepID=UPI003AB85AC9
MRLFVLGWLVLFGSTQAMANDFTSFEAKLNEAEDYLVVNPAQSIIILENLKELNTAPVALFIRWHLLYARTAVPTSHYDRLYKSIDAIFQHHQADYFKQKLTTIMSALGIWLRHAEYLSDAQISFKCAYKYAHNDRQRLTLTNSMALVARSQNDFAKARALYLNNLDLTTQLKLPNITALIKSNLGYLALDEGNVTDAERYFRSALSLNQNIDKRAGQISTGLNLLMVFLIQEHQLNFERLYTPTATLTHAFPNEAKQAQLLWLELGYKNLTGDFISQKDKHQLQAAYEQLESDKMKQLVAHYLAKKLDVTLTLPEPITAKEFTSPWFEQVKQCNWEKGL